MATMKNVAEKAGVSTATVSHVINGTGYVSDELTERVHEAMATLDYHPNTLAGSLRSGKSKIIGLIVPDMSNQFFSEISRKIEDIGMKNGYSIIVCNTDDDIEKEKQYINTLIAKQVDGIVFISAGEEKINLQKAISKNIPIIVADRNIQTQDVNVVLLDNVGGGHEGTKYLIELGHQRIGFISGISKVSPNTERLQGYKKALQEFDLPVDPGLIIQGDFRFQSGEKAMVKFLSTNPRPTAVFAGNDMMALGAIRAANVHGLIVPDDISILGFDNIPLADKSFPALTTMAQPTEEMAGQIMTLLIDSIDFIGNRKNQWEKEYKFQKVVLKPRLLERDSCIELVQ